MKNHPRSQFGMTLLEVVISMVMLLAVVAGAVTLVNSSRDLASSTTNSVSAGRRVDASLEAVRRDFRKGSLASARKLDDSTFSDGDTDSGFQIRPVLGFEGAMLTGNLVEYSLDGSDLVRDDGTIETVVAREVTAFTVSRAGSVFTFAVTTRSGPTDDRERTAAGEVSCMARNP